MHTISWRLEAPVSPMKAMQCAIQMQPDPMGSWKMRQMGLELRGSLESWSCVGKVELEWGYKDLDFWESESEKGLCPLLHSTRL